LAGWIILASCASLNVLWAWPGPNEDAWVTSISHLLHRSWLGLAPGVWCGGALAFLLLVTLVGWTDDLRIPGEPRALNRDRE
jgi:hypothetical protein